MKRRDFHKALAALIGLTVFDSEKAEAKEALATMSHEEKVRLAKSMVCPLRTTVDYGFEDIDVAWHRFDIALNRFRSKEEGDFKYLAANADEFCDWFERNNWYHYGDFPRIYPDKRIPRGHLWNFNNWNDDVVNRLQEDADWYREWYELPEDSEFPEDNVIMIYSDEDGGKFLNHEVLETGVPQRKTASHLIIV